MREKRPRGEMDPTGCSEGLTEACADSEMYRRVHLVTYDTVKVINMDNYGPSFELSSSKLLHLRSGSTKTSPHFMIISNFHVYPTPTYIYIGLVTCIFFGGSVVCGCVHVHACTVFSRENYVLSSQAVRPWRRFLRLCCVSDFGGNSLSSTWCLQT